MGAAREAREAAARESAAQGDNRAQDELRRRKKDTGGPYVDAGIPPQGPSGPSGPGSKVKKKVGRIVLPRNNPAQNTPSNQPTGVQVPGQHGAVMPNTTFIPANPPPTANNTREDDKPLPVSMREGQ